MGGGEKSRANLFKPVPSTRPSLLGLSAHVPRPGHSRHLRIIPISEVTASETFPHHPPNTPPCTPTQAAPCQSPLKHWPTPGFVECFVICPIHQKNKDLICLIHVMPFLPKIWTGI